MATDDISMKPSVMMSIKPKYCELIASSKKTIEVRKTRPKIETPLKCYIYCTLPKERFSIGQGNYACSDNLYLCDNKVKLGDGFEDFHKETISLNGKVIGEFVCDKIEEIHISTELMYEKEVTGFSERALNILNQSCLSYDEIIKYSGFTLDNYNSRKEYLYCWHISNFVIYDKPKELREFIKAGALCYDDWLYGLYNGNTQSTYENYLTQFKVIYPPQSWCYVEV